MPSHRAVAQSDLDNRCRRVGICNCHLDPLPSNGKDQMAEGVGHAAGHLSCSVSAQQHCAPEPSWATLQGIPFLITMPLRRETEEVNESR